MGTGTPTQALPLGAGLFVLFPLAGRLWWFIFTGHDDSGGRDKWGAASLIRGYRIKGGVTFFFFFFFFFIKLVAKSLLLKVWISINEKKG